jgi:hypothetical protein
MERLAWSVSPDAGPWLAVAALGAFHGINPAMGWLFAVALGLQQRSRRALVRALLPIALGHEASIACAALVVSILRIVAFDVVRALGAALLVAFGVYKLVRPRANMPWARLRPTLPELALWSVLMSTAHGAGLMLFPVLLDLPAPALAAHDHADQAAAGAGHALSHTADAFIQAGMFQAAGAVALHTAAMLAVMAGAAVLVYEWLGLGVLRRAWINLDRVWATAVIVAGVATLFT